MYISDLSLNDFRSYRSLVLPLEPGPSALVGSNGQGRTSLVEAIVYLATLSSHRAGVDAALVRRAALGQAQPAGTVVRVRAVHEERPSVPEAEIIVGKANRARLDRSGCQPRNLLGVLCAVVFALEDLSLVHAEPGVRQGFLDGLVVTLRPDLAGVRAEHDKTLAQRASLLKSTRMTHSSISSMLSALGVWGAQLTTAAVRLIAIRVNVAQCPHPRVTPAYETVSGASEQRSRTQLAYRPSLLTHEGHPEPDLYDKSAWFAGKETLLDEAALAARLGSAMGEFHAREIGRGTNPVGTHRDDLSLFLTGLLAHGFVFRGEQ